MTTRSRMVHVVTLLLVALACTCMLPRSSAARCRLPIAHCASCNTAGTRCTRCRADYGVRRGKCAKVCALGRACMAGSEGTLMRRPQAGQRRAACAVHAKTRAGSIPAVPNHDPLG